MGSLAGRETLTQRRAWPTTLEMRSPVALSAVALVLTGCGVGDFDFDDGGVPRDDAGLARDGGDGDLDAGPDDAGAGDGGVDAGPLPGAPHLDALGPAVFRSQPHEVRWRQSADDAARGAAVLRYDVQESADPAFSTGVRTFPVAAPATHLSRVHQGLNLHGAAGVTLHYRVRAVTAAGRGPFSNVEPKVVEAVFRPIHVSVGFRGPNAPPFTLGANAFTVDDVHRTNGAFERVGPGWLDTTDPNKGYQGHYWYVSNNAPQPRDGTEAARWTPSFARAGRYEVWVGFYRSENRDDHVEYFVTSLDGERLGPFTVDQYLAGSSGDTTWVKLGEFNVAAGAAAHVDLDWSPAGRSHSECADATAFRRL